MSDTVQIERHVCTVDNMRSYDFRPRRSALTGCDVTPPRPGSVASIDDLPGVASAQAKLADAHARLDGVHRQLSAQRAAIGQCDAARTDIARRARLGETIKPGSAGAVDRQRADIVADASITEQSMAAAEGDVKAARSALQRLLTEAATDYLAKLRRAAGEAERRAAAARVEANSWAIWLNETVQALQHAQSGDVDNLIVLLEGRG